MKILAIILYSTLTLSLVANELQWVDEQIEAIKPPRSGISTGKINSIKSPFIVLSKKTTTAKNSSKASVRTRSTASSSSNSNSQNVVTKKSKSLILDAIINRSALINGKWYKLNDKVGRYTLSAVNGKNVILSYKKKELLLSTASKNKNLKFKSN